MSSFVNPNMEADSASLSVVFIVSRLIPVGVFVSRCPHSRKRDGGWRAVESNSHSHRDEQ